VKSGQTREALDETFVVTVDAQSLLQVVHSLALLKIGRSHFDGID
jgi:hypothetical protein